jgi:flagella basal body P-ring formation protein FlgA
VEPRLEGNYTAVRVVRPLPTHARIQADDVALVEVSAGALPAHETRPRAVEEVLDAAVRRPLPAGLVIQDELLDLETLAPPAAAAALAPGERGLVAPVRGLGREVEVGTCLRFQGLALSLRLAAVSPPGPKVRSALLAGRAAALLEQVRPGVSFPLDPAGPASDCAEPPATVPPPPGTWREKVVVAARAIPRGRVLGADDVDTTEIPAGLLPHGALKNANAVKGQLTLHPLVAGQPLVVGDLGPSERTGDETTLYVPGLHPDWVHPGGVVEYLRAGQPNVPTPLLVVDIERSLSDAPTPLKVRPLPGVSWPRTSHDRTQPHQHGESDQLRWVLMLRR